MKIRYLLISLFAISLSFLSCMAQEPEVLVEPVQKEIVSQYGVPFNKVLDRRDVTIYQVNIRTFSQEGNFDGVTARLDSIQDLGANVIYLMPIYPVGSLRSVNSPYCIRDYNAVNPEFGTLEDLRELVDGAHARNMAVILDWVANHTSFDHVWIPKKTWYQRNEAGEIINPPGHNWRDVAQLDFSNHEMRLELIRSMKNWVLKANIDGFRCDYSDGPPFDFWKQAVDTLRNIKSHQLLLLSEGSRSNHFTAGFDYNFGFSFFGNLKKIFRNTQSVKSLETFNVSDYAGASDGQQMVRYTSNHDVNGSDGTPLDLFGGEKGSMAAFVVVAYMKGIPMIYNGQETGTPHRLTFPFTSTKIPWGNDPAMTKEYKKIVEFRNQSNAIRRGELTSFCSDDVCAFTKQMNNEQVLVLANLRDSTIDFSLASDLAAAPWKDAFTGKSVTLSGKVNLKPFEYLVLQK